MSITSILSDTKKQASFEHKKVLDQKRLFVRSLHRISKSATSFRLFVTDKSQTCSKPGFKQVLNNIQGGPKSNPQTFVHIFAKYWPIFKIFSSAQSVENF